ncbi:choice-of-anchor Q domain-containing protein [Lysobacter yangpyeongensis]|uniref:Choice-of-anchor Q domain-containing protein n=1 Tax=Lysobacter yangpyeongensis TaxID=346182 RepID=A0ABW0SNG7_9GAMM
MGSAHATTYYVRTDGGTASQCTGRSDAKYPGSGTARACAWNNPSVALPSSGSRRIKGTDTLVIGPGSYKVGSNGYMQPVPSGTSTRKTRIIGKSGTRPKLVGVGGTHRVLNLDGSSYVEVANLDITDASDCVYNHSVSAARCTSSMQWARVGVYARNSKHVWLHDLNIHGLAARGINAGGLAYWTVQRTKINRNGTAGWDGNVGDNGSNSGTMILRDVEIAWNGCGERVSTGAAWACWAQQTGGYGDGFGTTSTGGQWLVEDVFVHHNTSDGLDFRYMNGASTSKVTMRRVYAVANAGNQVKVRGNSLIENSVIVGRCTYFRGKYYMTTGDLCRAYGTSLLLVLTGGDTATVRHNTIAGEGDAQIAYGEGTSSDRVNIQNNLVVGFPYYRDTSTRTLFSGGSAPAVKSFSGNMGWHTRNCPTGTSCSRDPKLASMTLSTFDAEPLAGSGVIDRAPKISAVTTDFLEGKRPVGAANDIGAYEYRP